MPRPQRGALSPARLVALALGAVLMVVGLTIYLVGFVYGVATMQAERAGTFLFASGFALILVQVFAERYEVATGFGSIGTIGGTLAALFVVMILAERWVFRFEREPHDLRLTIRCPAPSFAGDDVEVAQQKFVHLAQLSRLSGSRQELAERRRKYEEAYGLPAALIEADDTRFPRLRERGAELLEADVDSAGELTFYIPSVIELKPQIKVIRTSDEGATAHSASQVNGGAAPMQHVLATISVERDESQRAYSQRPYIDAEVDLKGANDACGS